jgi:diacylglycerol kinase (ATP)
MTKIPTVESGPSERFCPNMTPGSFNQIRHANILVNPVAGRQKCGKLYPAVVDKLRDAGMKCDVTISRYPGELMEVAAELAIRGCETVVACGGDGTIHEIVNGIAGTETALGIVPFGATNDFARNLGLQQDMGRTHEIIKQGRTKRIDLVRVNQDRFFPGTACLGFDAEIAAFGRSRKIDPFAMNMLGGLFKFFSYKPKTVEMRFDGQRFFGEVFLVVFGNMRSLARDRTMPPEATFDDALLDICVVEKMPKRRVLSFLPSAYKGAHGNREGMTHYRTEAVFVQSMGPADLYAGGEFMATTPVRMEVVPKYLKVIVGSLPR